MNDEQIEQGLRDVLLAEPPLGVDPDRMVDTAVRNRRNRRAGIATGFGIVAGVAVAAGAMIFAGGGEPQPASPPKPSKQQQIEQEMAHNAAHLQDVLPKLVPKAVGLKVHYHAIRPVNRPQGYEMRTEITFTDAAGPAQVTVLVYSPKGTAVDADRWNDDCVIARRHKSTEGKPMRCEANEFPDHSTLRVWEAADDKPGAPGPELPIAVHELDMAHMRTDQSAVTVLNHRYLADGTFRSQYPLTELQEAALVTDPALAMPDPGE